MTLSFRFANSVKANVRFQRHKSSLVRRKGTDQLLVQVKRKMPPPQFRACYS